MNEREEHWWRSAVFYEVYVRSFMDANGDGIGDFPGVAGRLNYLRWLGVDALWLTPFYPSPMADFGYDVADYCDIDRQFGTLADFDHLLAEAHARDLKIVLDFVGNHSSDQHPWFVESRSDRSNPKRDWYLWRDPSPEGGPPNNWLSVFGGPAWTFDERTGQYYMHSYLREQPDLNWRNPEVEQAMQNVLRFWLDRGVDGFRIDAVSRFIKDDQFRGNPPNPGYSPDQPPHRRLSEVYNRDRPEVHETITRLRKIIDEHHGVMIGEAYLPLEQVVRYYGQAGGGVHFPFNFLLLTRPWKASAIREAINHYVGALPADAWPNWVLGNHDRPRIATRAGRNQAAVAATLLLTLRGTPTLYYGDEIGMENVPIPPGLVQDPREKNEPGFGLGRDPERTPMQWDDSPSAGFTTGRPWLPIAENVREINVRKQQDDSQSLLSLYRRLLGLRAAAPALQWGDYASLSSPEDTIGYLRSDDSASYLIVLNFSTHQIVWELSEPFRGATVEFSTRFDRAGETVAESLTLRGDEGMILRLRRQHEPAAT